jgi:hypothetical protein
MGTHEAAVIAHIAGLSAGGLGKVAHSIEAALEAARCADDAEGLGILEMEMLANGEQFDD